MYKVFINKTPILLRETNKKTLSDKWKVIPFVDGRQLKKLVLEIEKNGSLKKVCIEHFDLDELWLTFLNSFKYVTAAGGLVVNEANEVLMIKRNGKWDLPKGHLKKGERPEFGGMREVEEECGVQGTKTVYHLENTFHMYERKGMVVKKTFWYVMTATDTSSLIPQIEEGIELVQFMSQGDFEKVKHQSYPIIKGLLKKYWKRQA
jgi:ADP-ribose pyrophosphatase YjhB (NUDIX family)